MPDASDLVTTGISMTESMRDDLDERAESRTAGAAGQVSRSEIAREALAVGLEALDVLDEEYPQLVRTRDRRWAVRTALVRLSDAEDGPRD